MMMVIEPKEGWSNKKFQRANEYLNRMRALVEVGHSLQKIHIDDGKSLSDFDFSELHAIAILETMKVVLDHCDDTILSLRNARDIHLLQFLA